MAGASDKARFYLEQTVPELREWQRREIFTKDEITAIAAKRSDFEHMLNARGSQPTDYAKYAEYEINLDALRRKRVKRKGVKATAHTGQQRIFLILDRATRKWHGDVGLWMQYLEYARKQRANKKVSRILTEVLRMHPTKAELWVYAARYAMDVQADIQAARSYLQRGLRFCKTSRTIYLEYARLEMSYIAKISARHKILGLERSKEEMPTAKPATDDPDADVIAIPAFSQDNVGLRESIHNLVDDSNIKGLASTPALTGAIPIAIFDAAMKQFNGDEALGEDFFNVFADFAQVPYTLLILQHVVDSIDLTPEGSVVALSCHCRMLIIGIPLESPDFPAALGRALKAIKSSLTTVPDSKVKIAKKLLPWMISLSQMEGLAPELARVLAISVRHLKAVGG